MPTQNPRIQVTLRPEEYEFIAKMAEKESRTMAGTTVEMIRKAMELHEDFYWSAEGEKRLEETTEWVSEEEAWK